MKRIRGKYLVKGVILFSVRWKSTWVPLEAIVQSDDYECSYVEADGAKWSIRKELKSRVNNGIQERKVRWTNTKEPLENLANAQEALLKFETTRKQANYDDAQRVQRRTALTFEQSSFPHGVVRPQTDTDYAASQRWVACTWPMIRPHRTLDLYPAIYRIQMELLALKPRAKVNHQGKSYRDFMRQPQVRQLQWSEDYIRSGRSFHFNRRTRAALFLQVTGALETNSPCTRCLGEKLAPFVGCVRTAPDQQSWLGGACANCGTQDSSFCPHHRKGILGRGKSVLHDNGAISDHILIANIAIHAQASNKTHAGPHLESENASGTQGMFDADDPEDGDHGESDADDSDSDSDSDSEVDLGWPAMPLNRLAVPDSADKQQEPSSERLNAALSSTKAYPSPSNATTPPAAHARRGKLPKVSKTPRAARAVDSTDPPATTISQNSAEPDQLEPQPKDVTGIAEVGHPQRGDGEPGTHVKSFAAILADDTFVNDEFPPEPIEEDVMELLWKHITPSMSTEDSHPRIGVRLGRANRNPPALAQTIEADAVPCGLEDSRLGDEHSMRVEYSRPVTADGDGQSSITPRRKRRADSLAPRSKRLSLGLSGQGPSCTASDPSPEPSTSRKEHPSSDVQRRTFISVRSLDRMQPKSTHNGCVAGRPCNHHRSGSRPIPRNPRAKVYHNSLDRTFPVTVEQAEYILSQCNCYWAWTFTRLWDAWCADTLSVDAQKLSQVEVLLLFPNKLRGAAWDCCPRGERLVVELD